MPSVQARQPKKALCSLGFKMRKKNQCEERYFTIFSKDMILHSRQSKSGKLKLILTVQP